MKIYNKEKWEKVKLGEIFELQMGKTPSRNKENYWRHGENSWISISDMKNEEKYICDTKEKITDLAVEESKIKVIPKDTVIMSFKLSIGKLAITSKDMFTNEAIMAFFPKDKVEIDNNYLFYSLKKVNWTEGTNKAVKGLTLNKPLIASKEILLPSIQIQKEIAKRLDIVMEILKAKRKILLQLDELSKCLFIKMFKENYDKKNWENFSLEEIVEICSSKRVFLDQIVMEGIDFYRGTEIGLLSEGKKIEPKLFITKEHYENLIAETGKPKIGDLLLPSICNDGKIWYVNTEKPFYFKDGRVLWIKESDKVKGKFLQYFLRNEFLMNYKKIASGTTFSELKIFSLKKMKVKLPPIELQNQFAERVKMIEKSKFEIQKSIEETQKLFDSLMEKYFG